MWVPKGLGGHDNILFLIFIILYVCVYMSVSVCHMYAGTSTGPERASDALGWNGKVV